MAKLPEAFGPQGSGWLSLQLKNESASPISIEKEFALFKEAEKERTEKLFQQARFLKGLATVLAVVLFLLVIVGGVYVLRHQPLFRR